MKLSKRKIAASMIIDYYRYILRLTSQISPPSGPKHPFFKFYPCRLYLLRPTVQAYCGTSQLVRLFLFLATLFFLFISDK
jgi:hypothetical protein